MKSKIYIETSIPSFYYEIRTAPEIVARRNWTRQWWDDSRQNYEIVTSDTVVLGIAKILQTPTNLIISSASTHCLVCLYPLY